MNSNKYNDFNDRRVAAETAKKAAAEKFRARPGPDDPAVIERLDALKAIADARDVRIAERRVAREAEAARVAAEQAALAAAERARVAAEKARLAEEAAMAAAQGLDAQARAAELAAKQKAARDARYAARNARRK